MKPVAMSAFRFILPLLMLLISPTLGVSRTTSCTIDDDCHHDYSNCNTTTYECQCDDGYVPYENRCLATGACTPDPCESNITYCYALPGTELQPDLYQCILYGFKPGNCSLMKQTSCHELADCIDGEYDQSFTCRCQGDATGDGFNLDQGTGCTTDFIPCSVNADCSYYGYCNMDTYKCECNEGFEEIDKECQDIKDCPSPTCDPHAICTDYPGGFTCVCDGANNYQGDGINCTLVCLSDNNCHPKAICNADQRCECNPGYEGDGEDCVDIDECADPATTNCHEHAQCNNTQGSYECVCNNGYDGDGVQCTELPRNCAEIPGFTNGNAYVIDPDFTGPANSFSVYCDVIRGVVVTKVVPLGVFPLEAPDTSDPSSLPIDYEPTPEDLHPLLNDSTFCYQDISFACWSGFPLFPGTVWYDAFGQAHDNWGSTSSQQCACGVLSQCDQCMCNGNQRKPAYDSGRIVDKNTLPVVRIEFAQLQEQKGSIDLGPLICAPKQTNIPKDCHEAKFTYNILDNTVMYIDVDGPGGEDPFLVFCDMESFKHVGITEIPPEQTTVVPTTEEGTTITYSSEVTKLKALISGSVFCSQKVEFKCANSRLLGEDGGYVYGPDRRLDYFPGADGNQGLCGCGATQSCEQKEVKCNCDIQDGNERSDFGLIVDKSDLPAVKVTAQIGDNASGTYTIAPLQCSQKQFGIEPNCEKYRGTGITEDYSYLIDPDGPGNLDPFLVECDFQESPPLGVTIVHHEEEDTRDVTDAMWLIHYLLASNDQLNALTDRSTFCTQDVILDCKKFAFSLPSGTINFQGALDDPIELGKYLQTCGEDGESCTCTGYGQQTDTGPIIDLDVLPVKSLDFASVISQLSNAGSSLAITLGPLVCYETFPTCAELKKFIDGGQAVEGEATVINGFFTIDPDGPGGVYPFEVRCQFPSTIVILGPGIGDLPINPGEGPTDKCFDINYRTDTGDPISPEQITALVQKSDNCKQTLTLECESAPATGHVNFSTCDGKSQPGWAGSYGEDKCACGVNGNCDGGPQANCNCDVADGETRSDSGTILDTDRLPVCQVCFSIDASEPGPGGESGPTKLLRYKLGRLTCDGNAGVRSTCQDARRVLGGAVKEETERSTALNTRDPVPVGCRFYPDPPIGELIVKPKEPTYPPEGDKVDITIIYITINIDILFTEIKRNEYCTQVVYLYCTGSQDLPLTGDSAWYNYKGEPSQAWTQLPSSHEIISESCNANKDLCQRCGLPLAFRLENKEDLPLSRLVISKSGITVVVGEVSCFDLKASCQDIALSRNNRWIGFLGGRRYAIDPDGPGDIQPFSVNCDLDFPTKNGVTEVTVDGAWVASVVFTGKEENLEFFLSVEYPLATPEQIDALTKISNFCWQNVRYDCKSSPLLGNGNPSSFYSTFSGGNSSSFGTAEDTDFPGCACAVLGTCISGSSCNCDARGPMGAVDQGAVTNKDALPITGIYIGGQTEPDSSADVKITNIRCASKPTDPPLDCADALERANRYGVLYDVSSDYLISPDPDDADLKPFLVHCDFDTFPGVGVTVIKPNFPEGKNETKPPGEETTEEVPYYGPDKDQISALIARSAYCYQGVKYDCYASQLFAGGNYWTITGDQAGTRNTFWGGGEPDPNDPKGFCACGVTNNCGGLDGSTQQMHRRCNCDAGDNANRADAGIINLKEYLPIGSFIFAAESQFTSAALTVGDLYCSQEPLKFNECELGFHDCHHLATCKDLDEGYTCVCPPGWEGKAAVRNPSAPRANGRECIDDDECSWQPCPYSATCHNLPGSFNCTCNEGYTPVSPLECADINECLDPSLNNCHENARCENLDGTYRCRCNRGYRGDGETCTPVGVCSCFGDPHCQSFDNRFLHFQGLCEYVMSQDGCNKGETPTFRVLAEHWRQGNIRQDGYFSWVKSVRVMVLDTEIVLGQDLTIVVDGIQRTSYVDQHKLSVYTQGRRVKLKAITGLEVVWDGIDTVEVKVPGDRTNQTCGLCGNYNGDPTDDWVVGPACPDRAGQVTDNNDEFGQSWTVLEDSVKECTLECDREIPDPDPDTCLYPKSVVEQECDKLLTDATSPFLSCLSAKSAEARENIRYSCVYDLCNQEFSIDETLCNFASSIAMDCADNENEAVPAWKGQFEACKEPTDCDNNMVYKLCGPANPETCLTTFVDVNGTASAPGICNEGCFCAEGLVMEGDKCIKTQACGCIYDNTYLQYGEVIYLPDCSYEVTCLGGNETKLEPIVCGAYMDCKVEENVVGCYCQIGYRLDENGEKCIVDPCHGVDCDRPHAECDDGECVCKMGFIGDCNQCEDINECETGEHNCTKLGQKCVNTPGSHGCICEEGFVPYGAACKDVDECIYGLHNCPDYSECVNTPGSHSCECCAGYKEDPQGACVRDSDSEFPTSGKCCACQGKFCDRDGQVCGTDGNTYKDYRSLAITKCRNDDPELAVNYPGPCVDSCSMVQCEKQYATCELDQDGKPKCGCPTCEDSSTTYSENTVCASNHITYISVCHMKKDTCEAEIETTVEVVTEGEPCPGNGLPPAGPWSEWGDCSEPCKQGVRTRTRDVYGEADFHSEESIPCYNVCENGPCTQSTCTGPAQVCVVDEQDVPSCQCPLCVVHPEEEVCGRVGAVVKTYDNPCELEREACEQGQEDFELLEPRPCEERPKECGLIRNYRIEEDGNGCVAERSVDMGECYGGCDNTGDLCCFPTSTEVELVILKCPDGSTKNAWVTKTEACDCITQDKVDALKLNYVNP